MPGIIGTFVLLTLVWLSSRCYAHNGRTYAVDKAVQTEGTRSFRYVYRYIQFTTLAAGIGSYLSDGWIFLQVHHSTFFTYLGMLGACGAMAGFIFAKRTLGKNYSPCFDPYVPQRLVCGGFYRYVRHPIYTLNVLSLVSLFISTGTVWIGLNALVLTAYYIASARIEEKVLQDVFPEYETYAQETKRFIPLLY